MTKRDEYLDYAGQCRQMAGRTSTAEMQHRWLALSNKWLELANTTCGDGVVEAERPSLKAWPSQRLLSAQHDLSAILTAAPSGREPNALSDVVDRRTQGKSMSSQNQLYLRQAEHCRKMADASKVEQTKAEWLLLADRWLRMVREEVTSIVQNSHFEERKQA
jgi:hypothetical protein